MDIMKLSGRFFKHGHTEIRRCDVKHEAVNIADLLIQNNTKAIGKLK